MTTVTVQEAKTHLSRLLRRVGEGEEIVIRRGPTPVARLVPLEQQPDGRIFGAAAGRYGVAPVDVFAPLADDELTDWEGS